MLLLNKQSDYERNILNESDASSSLNIQGISYNIYPHYTTKYLWINHSEISLSNKKSQ